MTAIPPRKFASLAFAVLMAIVLVFFALRQPGRSGSAGTESRIKGAANQGDSSGLPGRMIVPPVPVSSPASDAAGPAHPQIKAAATPAATIPAQPRRTLPIKADFVATLATGPNAVSFSLPDGRTAEGSIDFRHLAKDGSPVSVTGHLTAPGKGNFFFAVQPKDASTGPVVGAVAIEKESTAFRVIPLLGTASALSEMPVDEVICRSYIQPPEKSEEPERIPADFPTSIPIPPYQNGVIPLQSRPGAQGVVYLDFDGQSGPHEGWGNFDAVPPNVSNGTIKDVWVRVCEDFAPFNLNITTDLQVYLDASETSRQRCIITPTTTAAPGAGGVAWIGSFNMAGDIPCWSFYASGKNSAEVISHEVGHTLGLYHDGRFSPSEGYYLGHGSDPVGWAPIMGAGYYKNLSQWSKGEYLSANQTQDDLAVIAANNNVGYRPDDAGATHASAALLEIFPSGVVNTQGTIETRSDVDAFRFTTTGGLINLSVTTVTAGPNLDISASLYDDSGSLLLLDNPNSGINATLAANLAPGEYNVRVDGTGRGSPLVDGYSDYGSLGQYTISGTVAGAVIPDRFTVAENSPAGTQVGTPTLRNNHGGASLSYSISAGNTGSALAIDPVTGTITVAAPSALDYEALSSDWTTPPALDLTISVSDSLNHSLDETLRVVVSLTNVNEPPVISGESFITAISHTVNGTALATVTASDPDSFDFPVYSISSGNASGKFAISQAGVITTAGGLDSTLESSHSLTIRVTDHGAPGLTADLPVTVNVIPAAPSYSPGFAYHTIYEGIPGSEVGNLTGSSDHPSNPSAEVKLFDFTDTTRGDNYGSTVRAWLIAPHTGSYQFWIAGDDAADLNFNPEGNPGAATRICYVTTPTGYQQWTLSGTQQSTTFELTAGQACYIEAVHKEGFDSDHLSVAWEVKDSSGTTTIVPREVIPGRYLSPHRINYVPKITANAVNLYRNSYSGRPVAAPVVSDLNPGDTHIWSITGGNSAGIFAIDPATGRITVADSAALAANPASSIPLTLTATDDAGGGLSGSGPLVVYLLAPTFTPTTGLIQEFWDNVAGSSLSSLYALSRYPDRPDRLVDLSSFDSGSGLGDNYGARIRAYVVPPETGSYTFHIASDESSTLLLSTDSNPAHATQIASVSSFTGYQSWTTYPSQTSPPVTLAAGQRYFIEARVKEGSAGDHLSVAWTGPSNPFISVIGEFDTEPYDSNVAPAFSAASYSFTLPAGYDDNSETGTVSATDSPFEEIRYAIVSGDPRGGFSIDPVTGVIAVANIANISIGATCALQVGAQDSGHGGRFVPRETLVPVTITVPGANVPPVFSADPVMLGSFPTGQPLSVPIAGYASDPRDILSFAMVSGPPWLTLSPAGLLTGTPDSTQIGPHSLVVSADDGQGHVVQGNVTLTVSPPSGIAGTSLTAVGATPSLLTGMVLSGNQASASTSDNAYLVLREVPSAGTSALDYRWTFNTPPAKTATLRVEAHHTANTEGDDFQFSVSTDGGGSFTNALLVTKTADDQTAQIFSFNTGPGTSTIIKVVDSNRTAGRNSLDRLILDLLAVGIPGNAVPQVNDAVLQVAHHAPVGVTIGTVSSTDADPGQSLSFSIPRGNEAGYFTMSPAGVISVAADIPEGAGPLSLVVVATDNGTPSLSNFATITVDVVPPLPATIVLSDLTGTYDGNPHPVTATPDPGWLPLVITYDGDPTPPVHPGTYQISVRIVSPIYSGAAADTQVIAKASASIGLADLQQPYDGTPRTVSSTTVPPDLQVNVTYDGSSTAPTNAGTYSIAATVDDPDYAGVLTDTLVVDKAAASLVISGLGQVYDGTSKSVTAVTDPPGLEVQFTYDGSTTGPTNAGTYEVVGTINATNHSGGGAASLVITPAEATIHLTNLSQIYNGSRKPVSFSTSPPGVPVEILYNGDSTPPTHAGSYGVSASVTDPNFTGASTAGLEILKAQATVVLTDLTRPFDGWPKPATVAVTPSTLLVIVTYDGSTVVPSAPGTYTVNAVVDDADFFGSASGTLAIRNNLVIADGQTLNPPDLGPTYHALINDGTLVIGDGILHIATDAINNGVMRLVGDAALDISGTFTNTGSIDIINWNGTLPPGLVNSGTIIDRSAIRILSAGANTSNFTFSIPGFDGHFYQLQSTTTPDGSWTPLGDPIPGSGSLASPPALEFSPLIDGSGKFFRVRVTPAP